jgi:hypothetical protein
MDINNIVIDTPSEVGSGMVLNTASKLQLNQIRKWMQFFAILGIVFCVLMLLVSFGLFFTFSYQEMYANMPASSRYSLFVVPILAVVIIPATVFAFKFSQAMRTALYTSNPERAQDAFKNFRNLFRYMGIFTIVSFVFYIFMFIFGVFTKGQLF